jgi:chromosome segregation ATPase
VRITNPNAKFANNITVAPAPAPVAQPTRELSSSKDSTAMTIEQTMDHLKKLLKEDDKLKKEIVADKDKIKDENKKLKSEKMKLEEEVKKLRKERDELLEEKEELESDKEVLEKKKEALLGNGIQSLNMEQLKELLVWQKEAKSRVKKAISKVRVETMYLRDSLFSLARAIIEDFQTPR